MKVNVSIIIVNYNSGSMIQECVNSIIASALENFEIILVDNYSTDSSLNFVSENLIFYQRVKLIKNAKNEGFAAGCNIGVDHANGKLFHFLNPDTIVNKSINKAYEFVISSKKEAIFVTPIQDENGNPIKSYYILPFLKNYFRYLLRSNKTRYWHIGANVIIKKDLFERLGRWPIDYFMYCEDMDLFYKAASIDIPVVTIQDAIITHLSKGTTKKIWSEFQRRYLIESAYVKFHRKYNKMWEYYIIIFLILLRLIIKSPKDARIEIEALLAVHFRNYSGN